MPVRNYDTEACDLLLSCIVNDPVAMPLLVDRLDADDFPMRQGLVWKAMVQCFSERARPTVHELLHRLGNTAQGASSTLEIVGKDYVDGLTAMLKAAGVHDTKKAMLFCERVEQSTDAATMAWLQRDIEAAAKKPNLQFDQWWSDFAYRVMDKRKRRSVKGAVQLSTYWGALEPALEAWFAGQPYMRITTGWPKLDLFMGGGLLQKGLHILAGPPGTSKTLAAVTWSRRQAEKGYVVGWSSLEMAGEMLLLRLVCSMAGVNWSRLMGGQLKGDTVARTKLEEAKKEIAKLPFFVDDRSDITTDDVHWQALRLSMMHDISVWYVDFADLLKDIGDDIKRIAKIFRRSKEIAKLLDIPIVVLSQVTKRVEYSDSKLPAAADVRYSGHDVADFVLMPWDVYKYHITGQVDVARNVQDEGGSPIMASDQNAWYLVVAKARYSEEGILRFHYNRQLGRISDLSEMTEPANLGGF